jgi:hypothetical protein
MRYEDLMPVTMKIMSSVFQAQIAIVSDAQAVSIFRAGK